MDITLILEELYRIVESIFIPKRVRKAAQKEIDEINKELEINKN